MTVSLGRILIVDDEAPVLEVLSEYFMTQGYAITTAQNGADALDVAGRERPDLVLLDVRMPGMDGVEVLKRLREREPGLAVIMVTANEDVALARETLKIGAFDYVAKPFDFRYLDRAVAAGLMQFGGADTAAADLGDDVWRRLAFTVFRAVRGMSAVGRAATGERMEALALAAAAATAEGNGAGARTALAQLELLVAIASDLGDLAAPARSAIESGAAAVRKGLLPGR
ncbi:MAG: response regulator [Candidatus Rokubacteria bacterium]|nr:response regulator [Candidatus Rokubacteria bacterium]